MEYVKFFAQPSDMAIQVDRFLNKYVLDVDDLRDQCFGKDFEKLFGQLSQRFLLKLPALKRSLDEAIGISDDEETL